MFDTLRGYDRHSFASDALAGLVVTLMLIPQSLAYALLAGLPPEAGLYASVVPLVVYALLGSSRVLAVGPVAVVSLMTAATVGEHAAAGTAHYATVALTLAFLSGALLLLMGLLRLGVLAQFLSHPVIAGFITAAALLIAFSQLGPLLGTAEGEWLHGPTALVGLGSLALLLALRSWGKPALRGLGLSPRLAELLARAGPVLVLALAVASMLAFDGGAVGVALVGEVPRGMPPFTLPLFDPALLADLFLPALLISVVGFVESVSVGQTLAAKRRQRVDPDRELLALGGSNLAASFSGGFPVTGGFARSVVQFEAGAQTQVASLWVALGILLASLLLTPLLYHLPKATLAATIVVAVLTLVDLRVFRTTWVYAKADFLALLATVLVTLGLGVEQGLVAGVMLSLLLHLWRSSRPHIAEVGRVPGTEHYRNVERHAVETRPEVLALRVDESLFFANARALEDRINAEVAARPGLRHVVLLCSAINAIDASALDSLEAINERLREGGLRLHLSEVKGPVMDRLGRSDFLGRLSGQVFLSHHQAMQALASG
ncbi:sulfate permease [Silanimonas sp.]|uniref:SulP family inorganic anion transporter n=1 Tax=Silanimonas sp. TaxID=1929290 RepID=UPI001BC50C58|nr:sulfate permease [Silanimonas sp.]MBS3895293.1 sulfate permease [Silanimonas sp.]MBS3923723.1 sulfate permease [Xanthomonadaceae bacterium]